MATSGYVTSGTAGSGGRTWFRVDWSRTSVDIPNNKSKVSWTLKLVTDNEWYTNAIRIDYVKINGTTVKSQETYSNYQYGTFTLASGTLDIPHNSDGTKTFTVELSGWFYGYGTVTGTGNFTLDTIPRASTMSFPIFTAGSAGTITISRASSGFTHTIQRSFGSLGFTNIATNVATSYSWTPPVSLLQQIPNATSGTGTLRLITYSGSTQIGSKDYTFTLQAAASAKPTASLTCTPNNSTQNATVQGWGYYIKGLSKIDYTIGFTGYQGSTVSAREFVGNGQTLTAASGTTNWIGSSGTLSLKARVKDSRGRWSDYVTQSITVYDYAQPVVNGVQAYRTNSAGSQPVDDGVYILVDCTAQVGATINNKNTLTVSCTVQDQSTGTIVKTATIPSSGSNRYKSVLSLTGDGFVSTKSYLVTITFTDTVGTLIVRSILVSTADVTFHLKEGGQGAAFGKYAEHDKALEVAADWDLYHRGDPIVDHVIAQGVSGIWTWRKWQSGISECWGIGTMNGTWQQWSGQSLWYLEETFNFPPELFVDVPMVVSAPNISSASSASCWGGYYSRNLTKTSVSRALYRPTQGSNSTDYYVSLDVKGRWK